MQFLRSWIFVRCFWEEKNVGVGIFSRRIYSHGKQFIAEFHDIDCNEVFGRFYVSTYILSYFSNPSTIHYVAE